jgi:hypothetical protein
MVASPLLPFDGFYHTLVLLGVKYFFVESKIFVGYRLAETTPLFRTYPYGWHAPCNARARSLYTRVHHPSPTIPLVPYH